MLREPEPEQTALEIVTREELVPADHLLRKIDAVVDFSFIHELTAPLYCADNGRPALDPTLMFKALFFGYLFGVRSERQLVREIQVNVAYRWFLRLRLSAASVMRWRPFIRASMVTAASRSAVPVAWVSVASTTSPWRFSMRTWPIWQSFAACSAPS